MSASKPNQPACCEISITSLWQSYIQQLRKRPILTKALTSAVLSGLGNLTAQVFVEKQRIDLGRLIKFSLLGLILSPVSHFKFLYLETLFRNIRGKMSVYGKLAVDQIIFGPIFNIIFFVLMAILDRRPSDAGALIRANFWPTTINSWKVWPIASFINFNYIPSELRVLFVNVVAFFWVIILSSIANNKK